MASNEHSSLDNSQLHVPKDFSTASANTVLTKNGSNALAWADDNLRRTHFVRVGGVLSGVTSTSEFAPTYAGNVTHLWNTVVTDPTSDAQDAVSQAQLYCLRDGYINAFGGVVAVTSGRTVNFKIYKGTPVDESSAAIDLTQLGSTASEVGGGTSTTDVFSASGLGSTQTFSAGDIIIVTVSAGDTNSTTARFNATMEVVYTE
tara:strand:+ start:1878 stop:2486 length:609 start_codon:yes stop_codon:yes gene_type:complete